MIENVKRIDLAGVELYAVTCSKETVVKDTPSITINFQNDDDLFDFVKNHIAFISDDDKNKFTLDIYNLKNERAFSKRLLDLYEESKKFERLNSQVE